MRSRRGVGTATACGFVGALLKPCDASSSHARPPWAFDPKQTQAAFERPIFYLPVTPRGIRLSSTRPPAPRLRRARALDVNRDLLATMCAPERRESIRQFEEAFGFAAFVGRSGQLCG